VVFAASQTDKKFAFSEISSYTIEDAQRSSPVAIGRGGAARKKKFKKEE
jgi:hypothetical protein